MTPSDDTAMAGAPPLRFWAPAPLPPLAPPPHAYSAAALPRAYLDADPAAAEAWLTPITFTPGRRGA